MSDMTQGRSANVVALRSSLVAAVCFLHRWPLLFAASPRTPLRALGVIALDTLHVLREGQPLAAERISALAAFLDFQGCANAAWDHKHLSATESEALRARLDGYGLRACVDQYLDRLRQLESGRPSIDGNERSFAVARSYREAVAWLAIATAAAIALKGECCAEDIREAHTDPDIDTLFRILMQCQIIDDVMDYPEDLAAGLPSFLTSSASLRQAMRSTAASARFYSAARESATGQAILPVRIALGVITVMTKVVLHLARPGVLIHISRLAH